MTFEEFEKASPKQLREQAKSCFETYQEMDGGAWERKGAKLIEAQFYMQERDRRHDSWISLRDLILELIVIALIGGEIWLGRKQDDVLVTLQESSTATAVALMTVQSSNAAMNDAVQQQVGKTKDVALSLVFDSETNGIIVTNTGKLTVALDKYRYGSGRGPNFTPPLKLRTGESAKISADPIFKMVGWLRQKSYSTDFTLDLETEDGAEFIATFQLSFVRLNDETHVVYSPAYLRQLHGPSKK